MSAEFWSEESGNEAIVSRRRTLAPKEPKPPRARPGKRRNSRRTGGIGGTTMLIAFLAVGTVGHFAGSGIQSFVAPRDDQRASVVATRPAPTSSFVF